MDRVSVGVSVGKLDWGIRDLSICRSSLQGWRRERQQDREDWLCHSESIHGTLEPQLLHCITIAVRVQAFAMVEYNVDLYALIVLLNSD